MISPGAFLMHWYWRKVAPGIRPSSLIPNTLYLIVSSTGALNIKLRVYTQSTGGTTLLGLLFESCLSLNHLLAFGQRCVTLIRLQTPTSNGVWSPNSSFSLLWNIILVLFLLKRAHRALVDYIWLCNCSLKPIMLSRSSRFCARHVWATILTFVW